MDKEITQEFLEKMASGVPILDTVTRPCKVEKNRKIYIFDHFDTGAEPPDTQNV